MINVEKLKNTILLSAMSGKLVESNCNWSDINFSVPIWSVTAWDKKFKNVDKEKQKQIKYYNYILSNDMFKIARDFGDVYLLSTGQYEGYTIEELAGDYLAEGEVVTLPWGGTPIIKYFKGKFVTSDNRIATSIDIDILDNKFLYYFILSKSKYLDSNVYRGTGLRHPEMRKVLDMMIPLPPLEEQKRIVAKLDEIFVELDRIDVDQNKLVALLDKLEDKLLGLAIQGKLVEQRSEEGTGEELFKQIQVEKQELINQGKIKKEKPIAEITEDEIPFEIPSTWKWVRLGELSKIITKGSSPKWQGIQYVEKGLLFVTSENVGKNSLIWDNKKYVEKRFNDISPRSNLEKGDLLTNIVGASIGRTALFDLDENANINQAVCVVKLISKILTPYISMYMNSTTAYKIMLSDIVDTARANISLTNITDFIIPLPPYEEQKRIVAKLNELLPQVKSL